MKPKVNHQSILIDRYLIQPTASKLRATKSYCSFFELGLINPNQETNRLHDGEIESCQNLTVEAFLKGKHKINDGIDQTKEIVTGTTFSFTKSRKKVSKAWEMNHFKGKQFQQDVIIVAVGYYLRYNLSYREVQELLYDRGINVCHTTIYRWVQEYSKILYHLWKKKNKQSFYSWKMDESYIKIKGRWHYLYRAIDADGLTLDIWLRKKRDTQAAYAFLKRLHKQFGQPRVIVTDKAPSIGSAFRKLQRNGLYTKTEHRTVKYLNNLIEQNHRPIKRRNKFYRSLRTASSTIKGMETFEEYIKRTEEMVYDYDHETK